MVGESGRWYTSMLNPVAYWVEMSVVLCLGLGHYLLSLYGPTVFAVGSFPLFLLTGLAVGLAAHSMWLVGRTLLPVVVIAFFAGGLAFGEAGGLLCVPVAAVGTVGAGVVGYRW